MGIPTARRALTVFRGFFFSFFDKFSKVETICHSQWPEGDRDQEMRRLTKRSKTKAGTVTTREVLPVRKEKPPLKRQPCKSGRDPVRNPALRLGQIQKEARGVLLREDANHEAARGNVAARENAQDRANAADPENVAVRANAADPENVAGRANAADPENEAVHANVADHVKGVARKSATRPKVAQNPAVGLLPRRNAESRSALQARVVHQGNVQRARKSARPRDGITTRRATL